MKNRWMVVLLGILTFVPLSVKSQISIIDNFSSGVSGSWSTNNGGSGTLSVGSNSGQMQVNALNLVRDAFPSIRYTGALNLSTTSLLCIDVSAPSLSNPCSGVPNTPFSGLIQLRIRAHTTNGGGSFFSQTSTILANGSYSTVCLDLSSQSAGFLANIDFVDFLLNDGTGNYYISDCILMDNFTRRPPPPSFKLVGAVAGWAGTTSLTPPAAIRISDDASLNQKSSIWYTEKVDLSVNQTWYFNSFFGCKNSRGGDGMAFVLQNNSLNEQGYEGGGMAYGAIANSFIIEFDTWNNCASADGSPNKWECSPVGSVATWEDVGVTKWDKDHIAFNRNGDEKNPLQTPVAVGVDQNIEDCKIHLIQIRWIAATKIMEVYFDGAFITSIQRDIVANDLAGASTVYWGITGSTGNVAANEQWITYNGTPTPPYPPYNCSTTDLGASCENLVLPVDLLFFEAEAVHNSTVRLKWATTRELDNTGFKVMRSANLLDWFEIGYLGSMGNSSSAVAYQFDDPAPMNGHNYYLLNQVDHDGKESNSSIRSVKISTDSKSMLVYPNPVANELNIIINNVEMGNAIQIQLFELSGREVLRDSILSMEASYAFTSISTTQLPEGIYFLKVSVADTEILSQKVTIQK